MPRRLFDDWLIRGDINWVWNLRSCSQSSRPGIATVYEYGPLLRLFAGNELSGDFGHRFSFF